MTTETAADRSHLPLNGICVVELSTMIAASYAAMILGEQGADVAPCSSANARAEGRASTCP
ncbi:CoA transferase [uncultured Algimonas sp.]|uniref:CoA transferase n=1 Tax=uncultured Algimonas sp. TaxID=1547920 RepID=UPI0026354781|nr:CoA transferase [uncultured Algimonas sp.]